jgi:hypothetical protein
VSTHELAALSSTERSDPTSIASQYEPVYESLLDAALR